MKTLAEQFEDQNKQLVWLDSWDYCQALFLNGEKASWGDSAGFDGFVRKSDALLQPSVTSLPLSSFLDWVLCAMPNLKSAMAEKSRTGYALKTLLRNEDLRKAMVQALNIAANAVPNKAMVLEVPSPRTLVAWAYQVAHDRTPENLTVDHADSASVYLSDFVSSLGATNISALLISEVEWSDGDWKEESTIYTPLKNVSNYQQWSLGLKVPFSISEKETISSFDFLVSSAEEDDADITIGNWVQDSVWSSDSGDAVSSLFIYSKVPANSVPERVLENRKRLGGF